MTSWTRVTDPEDAEALLPAWFAARMMAMRGSYGFLLATGDVVRASRVMAVHVASAGGPVLVDVLLDHAGVPGGVDMAWQSKHYLGAPVPGANLATLNLAQIAMALEFTAAEIAETVDDAEALAGAENDFPFDPPAVAEAVVPAEAEPTGPERVV